MCRCVCQRGWERSSPERSCSCSAAPAVPSSPPGSSPRTGTDSGLGIGFVGVSLAFGLTVLTMAYTVGHISGGHFNPAITLGLAAGKRFAWKDAIPYIVTQVVAAIAASATLWVIAVNQRGDDEGFARRRRLRSQRLRRPLTRPVQPVRRSRHRDRAVSDVPDRHHGHDRQASLQRLRRGRHRPRPHADPPREHPGHQHLGEPGPLNRTSDPARVRRRVMGARTAVAVLAGADRRRAREALAYQLVSERERSPTPP